MWGKDDDWRIVKKNTLTTDLTFVALGTEHRDEYTRLTEARNDHIVFTDKQSVPDMKVVEGTHYIFQIQGNIDAISPKSGRYIPPFFYVDVLLVLSIHLILFIVYIRIIVN